MPGPNPFRPGFGVSPRVLAGRDELVEEFDTALDEGPGSPLRSVLVSGARGMGKTVILNELEEVARGRGWLVVRLPETGDLLEELAATLLPRLLAEHDSERAVHRRVTGGGVAGLGSVTTTAKERYPVRESAGTLLERLLDVLGGGTRVHRRANMHCELVLVAERGQKRQRDHRALPLGQTRP